MNERSYLDLIDRHTPGPRDDVSPLFANAEALAAAVADLAASCEPLRYEVIAAIDALGFALGGALATRVGRGLILVRKQGKLPVPTLTERFVDYTGEVKSLEVRADLELTGARVLIVDEWIETAAQVTATAQLIKRVGGVVAGVACLHADAHARVQQLASRFPLVALSGQVATKRGSEADRATSRHTTP